MGINVLKTPPTLGAANSELWYRFSSPESGYTNFKYVCKVSYKPEPFATSAAVVLGTYKIPPNPSGEGLFSPHRTIKSLFTPSPSLSSSIYVAPANGMFAHSVQYGFEYTPTLRFASTFNSGGFLALQFSSAHGLVAGDMITIDKDNKQTNISYDGTASVSTILSTTQVKTNKPIGMLTTNESGAITNLLRYFGSTSYNAWAINATRQYGVAEEMSLPFVLYSSTSRFLTDYGFPYGTKKKVRLGELETLSAVLPASQISTASIVYRFYTASGTLLATTALPLTGNTKQRIDIAAGPGNIQALSTYYPSMSAINTCAYYSIYVRSAGSVWISESKSFEIDSSCTQYTPVRLAFLNRLGAYDFFTFLLDSKKSVSVKREEYNKVLPWNYSYGDREATVFSTAVETSMTINSNWLAEREYGWLEQLITSPDVFIVSGTSKFPVIVTDTKFEQKSAIRDRIFNMTLNIKFSSDTKIQGQ